MPSNKKKIYIYKNYLLQQKGDTLKRGERIGLIRFGSAMEYNFPKSYNISVKKEEYYSLEINLQTNFMGHHLNTSMTNQN